MKAFLKYLWIQLKMDLRDKGTLMHFYLVPLLFFFIIGSVFSSTNPLMKTTLAATMTIFAVTMGAVMGSPTPIVKMRESGTLRAFKVNGIPSIVVLSIQAFSAFIHLLLVSIIIYVVTPILFHSNKPQSPKFYFAILVLFLFTSIGVGLFIGVISRDQSFSTMLSMIIFLPSLLLSGIMFPATMLPKTFMWLGRIFPATYALQSFYGLAYQTNTNINANLCIYIIAMVGVFMFILSMWRFNNIRKDEKI